MNNSEILVQYVALQQISDEITAIVLAHTNGCPALTSNHRLCNCNFEVSTLRRPDIPTTPAEILALHLSVESPFHYRHCAEAAEKAELSQDPENTVLLSFLQAATEPDSITVIVAPKNSLVPSTRFSSS